MANQLSNQLIAQMFAQESGDPFLILVTLTHPDFAGPVRLVNNQEDIVSNGETFSAFPMEITLPIDDESNSAREIQITFANTGLELVDELRGVQTPINVQLDMILASTPDIVEFSFQEFKLRQVSFNQFTIQGSLYMDDFLNTELTSENYSPSIYPGLYQ
jgi:hypothetical protein